MTISPPPYLGTARGAVIHRDVDRDNIGRRVSNSYRRPRRDKRFDPILAAVVRAAVRLRR
jgi:hypothetical protein